MRVTGLGHASALIETAHGSVLCDPWVNPAYFGSWFPFPDNSELDWDAIGQVDYLYVSHLHRDHYDTENLKRISKSATVLLPEFPTDELHDALRDAGFTKIFRTKNGEVHDLGGLKVMIQALISPTDGPIGDSSLWLDDGTTKLLNQNDARPPSCRRSPSWATWTSTCSSTPARSGTRWSTSSPTTRSRSSASRSGPASSTGRCATSTTSRPPGSCRSPVRPASSTRSSGSSTTSAPIRATSSPTSRSSSTTWPRRGRGNGVLLLPGSVCDFDVEGAPVEHPYDPATVFGANKEPYLRTYQERKKAALEAEKASWAHPEIELLPALKEWIEPLIKQADTIAAGINGPVRFTALSPERGDVDVLFDFVGREVRAYDGERVRYRFTAPRELLEHLVAIHEIDWVNSLFLSCRFTAHRVGPYNEFVYAFFKCLGEERLNYAEGWFAEQNTDDENIELEGWEVQRRCPHLKADLTKFGKVEDGVLTCQMHGWKWRLQDGKCLTSVGHPIRSTPAGA